MEFDKEESYKQFLECKKDNKDFFQSNEETEICITERYTPFGALSRSFNGTVRLYEKDNIGIAKIPVLTNSIFTDEFLTSEQVFVYDKEKKLLRINFNFNAAEPFSRVLIEVQFPFI